jgi:hypothetical protein
MKDVSREGTNSDAGVASAEWPTCGRRRPYTAAVRPHYVLHFTSHTHHTTTNRTPLTHNCHRCPLPLLYSNYGDIPVSCPLVLHLRFKLPSYVQNLASPVQFRRRRTGWDRSDPHRSPLQVGCGGPAFICTCPSNYTHAAGNPRSINQNINLFTRCHASETNTKYYFQRSEYLKRNTAFPAEACVQ